MSQFPPLFHVSFGSRLQTEFCCPKGPSFKRARGVSFMVNGCMIELRAPRHRAGPHFKQIKPRPEYNLSNVQLENKKVLGKTWQVLYPFCRVWDFYGPWFIGEKGWVRANVSVERPFKPSEGISFFHPQVFESTLSGVLTSWLKDDDMQDDDRQRWIAPVDWQPINHFPCVAATFDIHGDQQDRGNIKKCLAFPLADDLLCLITLEVFRPLAFVKSSTVPEDNVDDWISDQPMIDLADKILGSVKLTLSPEAEAQQAKALEGLDNPHLSETFAPLNWGPEGGSEVNDRLLAEFIQQHEAKKRNKLA